jgi:nucleoid-associated protein YgaU
MSHSVYHSSVNLPPCMPRPATRRHAGGRRTRQHGRRPDRALSARHDAARRHADRRRAHDRQPGGRQRGGRQRGGRQPGGWQPGGRPSSADRRPHYGRRRVAAALLAGVSAVVVGVVLFVAILAIGLLAGSGGRPASASRAEPANTADTTYVAVAGDSLWSIAEANHGEVDIDRYVEALIDTNGGTSVQIGQAVRLP